MRFGKFNRILRASTSLPVTRDEAFVARVVGTPAEAGPFRKSVSARRFARAIAAAASAFAALVFGFYSLTPVAALTVDANPSMAIAINRFDRVVGLHALNEDAEAVVDEVAWFGRTPEAVVADLGDALVAGGWMDEDGTLLLALSGIDAAEGARYEAAIASALPDVRSLFMSSYATAQASVSFLATPEFQESVDEAIDDRSSFWDDVFAAAGDAMITGVVTTTAPASTETSNVEPVEDVEPLVLTLDDDDLVALASSFGVTVAKLRLALAVFAGDPAYRTSADLESLSHLSVDELVARYDALP
ncbi:MAG: hypothetical protein WC509_03185 [Candidatus Izemoplasmatales bacterium]